MFEVAGQVLETRCPVFNIESAIQYIVLQNLPFITAKERSSKIVKRIHRSYNSSFTNTQKILFHIILITEGCESHHCMGSLSVLSMCTMY